MYNSPITGRTCWSGNFLQDTDYFLDFICAINIYSPLEEHDIVEHRNTDFIVHMVEWQFVIFQLYDILFLIDGNR